MNYVTGGLVEIEKKKHTELLCRYVWGFLSFCLFCFVYLIFNFFYGAIPLTNLTIVSCKFSNLQVVRICKIQWNDGIRRYLC